MNLFALSGLLTFITSFTLGIFTLFKSKKILHIIWALFCFAVAIWGWGAFKFSTTLDKDAVFFWLRFGHIGVTLIPVLFLHFIFKFLEIKKKGILFFTYIVGGIFFILNITDWLGITKVFIVNLRFVFNSFYVDSPPGSLYIPFVAFFFWAVIYAHYKGIQYFRVSTGLKRIQLKYLLSGTAISFIGGGTAFLMVFKINIYPYYHLAVPIHILVITYAIFKYRLMDINIIICKTIIYSILASFIAIIFTLFIILFEYLFKKAIGYRAFPSTLLVALLIAIFFQPLYRYLSNIVDKLFFKGTLPQISNELQRSEKLAILGVLASGLAHEIKNPLVPIKTCIQNLPNNLNNPDFINKITKIIPEEVDKITDTINQLRDFVNPPPLNISKIKIHGLIDERLNLLEQEFSSRNITIERQYSPAISEINADPIQLERVFINLFLNAIDAMPNGGKLTISTETTQDNEILIKVSDTGIGISQKDLPHIFDPFYSKGKHKGTGLGLAVSHQIIEEHKGTILVYSILGRGTTFSISIPNEY